MLSIQHEVHNTYMLESVYRDTAAAVLAYPLTRPNDPAGLIVNHDRPSARATDLVQLVGPPGQSLMM